MSDLQRYVAKRKATDLAFATNFDIGYNNFRTAVLADQKHGSTKLMREQITQLHSSRVEERESQDGN